MRFGKYSPPLHLCASIAYLPPITPTINTTTIIVTIVKFSGCITCMDCIACAIFISGVVFSNHTNIIIYIDTVMWSGYADYISFVIYNNRRGCINYPGIRAYVCCISYPGYSGYINKKIKNFFNFISLYFSSIYNFFIIYFRFCICTSYLYVLDFL